MHTSILQKHLLIFLAVWLGSFTSTLANNQSIPLPTTLLELRHSPSPYECAVLSAHVYQADVQEGTEVSYENCGTKHNLQGWKVLKIFQSKELSQAWQELGLVYYCQSILYVHEAKKQLVLSHRGIALSKVDVVHSKEDKDKAKNVAVKQEQALWEMLKETLKIAQKHQYALTITGHSLGGWLAQLTAFWAQRHDPQKHVNVIAFDSPGAKPMLVALSTNQEQLKLDHLDITNYLSTPNLLNTYNPHVGTLYQVVFKPFARKGGGYNQLGHAIHHFLEAFNSQTGDANQCTFVQQWPLLSCCRPDQTLVSEKSRAAQIILELLTMFREHTQGSCSNGHQSFFQALQAAFRHHSNPLTITKEDDTNKTHTCIYKAKPCNPSYLHIRHIPRTSQQFLIGVQCRAPANLKVAQQHPLVYAMQWNHKKDYVSIPMQQD
ncbi:MAG: Mbeg1-like protein, partial [Bacteroidota bacterium]